MNKYKLLLEEPKFEQPQAQASRLKLQPLEASPNEQHHSTVVDNPSPSSHQVSALFRHNELPKVAIMVASSIILSGVAGLVLIAAPVSAGNNCGGEGVDLNDICKMQNNNEALNAYNKGNSAYTWYCATSNTAPAQGNLDIEKFCLAWYRKDANPGDGGKFDWRCC